MCYNSTNKTSRKSTPSKILVNHVVILQIHFLTEILKIWMCQIKVFSHHQILQKLW